MPPVWPSSPCSSARAASLISCRKTWPPIRTRISAVPPGVVHAGCRKVLADQLTLEPVLKEAEGATIKVPAGFDAQRIRLTGNIAGQPPFTGTLRHHGWQVTSVRLPAISETLDPRVVAPAEVEL